jgi:glycosyltransferase involved in cell wall biosynthesis
LTVNVTVVIPTYNAQSTIAATLDSVRAQTHTNWELILVDGGSTDNTFDIANDYSERDPRICAIEQANCANTVDACNFGIAQRSRGSKYVLVLDSDDLLVPDALSALVEVLENEKRVVAAYGRFRIVDEAGQHLRTLAADRFTDNRVAVDDDGYATVLPVSSSLTFNALVVENCVKSPGQMLIRADALRRLGPFDPEAFPCDDWDMWIRLSLIGEIRLVDKIVLEYRVSPDSAGLTDHEMEPGELYFRRKLAHLLRGDDMNYIALAGWRLRERRLIGRRLRSAMTFGLAGRRRDAAAGLLSAARDASVYFYHWANCRDLDDPPRHAGRLEILRTAAMGA